MRNEAVKMATENLSITATEIWNTVNSKVNEQKLGVILKERMNSLEIWFT
jgi:hypothetical protein